MITLACQYCGTDFKVTPSRIKHGRGRHCSPTCQYASKRAAPKQTVSFECTGCEKTFERYPSWTIRKGGGKFCTRECRDLHWKGEVTPNWQNGDGVATRGPHWASIRRRVLKRDGKVCQCCGVSGLLHVHHVIPFRMFPNAALANDEDNLVSLCPPCHRRADARHKWVAIPQDGGIIRMNAGGVAWQMAREKGLI